VTLAPPLKQCPCGRSLPILERIEGRDDDVIVTADGRRIGRLDPVFKADFSLVEAQIVQESRERLRVRLVPGDRFNGEQERAIIERLRAHVGSMDISVECVTRIPRGPNGKFKAVVSLLAHESTSGALGSRPRPSPARTP